MGLLPWTWYAVTMARSTFDDEITDGPTHYPAQGLSASRSAPGLSAVTAAGTPGRVVQAWLVSGAAFVLGVESAINPGLVGSPGIVGGLAAAT